MVPVQKGSAAPKIQSSNARQLHLYQPPEDERKIQAEKAVRRRARIAPIVLLVLGFALAVVVVMRFSTIAQNSSRIYELKNELAQVQKQNASLEHELSAVQHLDVVMTEASGSLAMNAPTEDQIRYVKLPMLPSEAQAQAEAMEQERQSASAQDASPIRDFFSRVASWLD